MKIKMKKKKLMKIIRAQKQTIETQILNYRRLNDELQSEKEQRKLWAERCMQLRREKTEPKYVAYRSDYSEIDGEWIEKRYKEGDLLDHPQER